MRRTTIDGVTVFSADGPPAQLAMLTFGCGARDERLDLVGLNDALVAHAMSQTNAQAAVNWRPVAPHLATIGFVGSPAEVALDLTTFCAAVAALLDESPAPASLGSSLSRLGQRFPVRAWRRIRSTFWSDIRELRRPPSLRSGRVA